MNYITILVLISCFAFVFSSECACGVEGTGTRIVGGVAVPEAKYPWMSLLLVQSRFGFMQCGGSIINDLYILTAAHCVYEAHSVRVGIGSSDFPAASSVLYEVENSVMHPNYNYTTDHNDIALVKLRQPLTMTRKVRPVCLPPADMGTNGNLTVAGWGLTEYGRPSSVLLETFVEEYDWDSCNQEWEDDLTDNQFCAALIGKDSCGGDSGGPLSSRKRGRHYVVGVVSFGNTDCGSVRSSVYTKVTKYLDWIRDNTKDAVYCSN